MKENQKKAFDFAAETTKQLITISTAIITLTVTFSKDILGNAANAPKTLLTFTWLVFILSIICGVATLMTLTGTLQPMTKVDKNNSSSPPDPNSKPQVTQVPIDEDELGKININNGNIRLFSVLQAIFFIVAIIMTGFFGYKSLNNQTSTEKNKNTYPIIRQSILNGDSSKKYIDTLYLPK